VKLFSNLKGDIMGGVTTSVISLPLALAFGVASGAGYLGPANWEPHLSCEISAEDLVVMELSSAQLEDLPRIDWQPQLAVVTNLIPHHLDRYSGVEGYVAAKMNLVRAGDGSFPVVMGPVDAACRAEVERAGLGASCPRLRLGHAAPGTGDEAAELDVLRASPAHLRGFAALDEHGTLKARGADQGLIEPVKLSVPGRHNRANAACALVAARCLELSEEGVRAGLAAFAGLPHRLEFVREIAGVSFINDSKATAPGATVIALEAMERPIVAIIAGLDVGEDARPLIDALVRRCRAAVCVGEWAARIGAAVAGLGGSDGPQVRYVDEVGEGVREALALATDGDAGLFSPGGTSFDRYANFEERGKAFWQFVEGL